VSEAVHNGRIHLFLDQLDSRPAVVRTLWHELLHYGLRRFLTREQYIAQMHQLYRSDRWVRLSANRFARSDEGQRASEFGGEECARTRGVDEALAQLAERSRCEFINTGLVANVAGGAGHPGNMEWRTREDHALKTKFDTMQCRLKRAAARQ